MHHMSVVPPYDVPLALKNAAVTTASSVPHCGGVLVLVSRSSSQHERGDITSLRKIGV
jgi:hypothetical protein